MRKPWWFLGFEGVVRWLIHSRYGRQAVREALYAEQNRQLREELLDRSPTHVIVELGPAGGVRVYGEKHVRAIVIRRPIITQTDKLAETSTAVDMLLELEMPPRFRAVYWPRDVRASGSWSEPWLTVKQWCQAIEKRDLELVFINGLNAAADTLAGPGGPHGRGARQGQGGPQDTHDGAEAPAARVGAIQTGPEGPGGG